MPLLSTAQLWRIPEETDVALLIPLTVTGMLLLV
jgi:hypothetical protein